MSDLKKLEKVLSEFPGAKIVVARNVYDAIKAEAGLSEEASALFDDWCKESRDARGTLTSTIRVSKHLCPNQILVFGGSIPANERLR